jgi:hypothetical protein
MADELLEVLVVHKMPDGTFAAADALQKLRIVQDGFSSALVLLSAVLGAIFGSIIGFWIGDRYGYPLPLHYGSYIGLTETRIKIAQLSVSAPGNGSCPHRSLCGCVAIGHRVHCGGKPDAVFQIHDCQQRGRAGLGIGLWAWSVLFRKSCRGICTTIRDRVGLSRRHRGCLDDRVLAVQGTGACCRGRA